MGHLGGHGTLLLLLTSLIFGTESAGMDCRTQHQRAKSCWHKHNKIIYQGDSKSFVLQYSTTKQILFSRCDPQTGEEEILFSGRPGNLHKEGNEMEVSLMNQNMTVKNAKKRNKGLYNVLLHFNETCLEQVNLTVLDPPSSTDVTPTSNVSIPTGSTVTPSGSSGLNGQLVVPAAIIISAILTICYRQSYWTKFFKKNSSRYRYTASSQSPSTEECGSVENGVGQHEPPKSHLVSKSKL